jgi:trans-aconitate methyltransferase
LAVDEELEAAKERAWRETAAIDAAYARGELDDAGWHDEAGQSFLDVGCANGHLMESMARWAGVEPYGLDISPELAELARRRLPRWADRIWVGNALDWRPPRRFDVVRTAIDYVPDPRRQALVEHLLSFAGRLVIGVFNEERDLRTQEQLVTGWGFEVVGRSERTHTHPRLAYKAFWIDAKS